MPTVVPPARGGWPGHVIDHDDIAPPAHQILPRFGIDQAARPRPAPLVPCGHPAGHPDSPGAPLRPILGATHREETMTTASRVALITGCGKPVGIGNSTARALAAAGIIVVVSDVAPTGVANEHNVQGDVDPNWG